MIKQKLFALALVLVTGASFAKPTVVAHRGASGYLPEHTIQSAILAYAQGADYIEQDLVLSKDKVPVVLHDIHLETVTDVEQKFSTRAREDGRFYAIDFTLAELKTLRVHERQNKQGEQVFANRYQGQSDFQIATFEEHIRLINELNRQFGKNVGIYPEIKSPAWHVKEGADITKIVLAVLRQHNLDAPDKAVYVQCFDFNQVKRLRTELGAKVKLVQLLAENDWQESDNDYNYLKSAQGLNEIAKYADGIGPWIPQLIDLKTLDIKPLLGDAKNQQLTVHPYTFRKDQLPEGLNSDQALDLLFKRLKVDGVFTDFTDTVVTYLQK